MNRYRNESLESRSGGSGPRVPFRHYSEEEWIDWIGNDIQGSKREDMQRHLERCPACRELYGLWIPLLAGPSPSEDAEGRGGAQSADNDYGTVRAKNGTAQDEYGSVHANEGMRMDGYSSVDSASVAGGSFSDRGHITADSSSMGQMGYLYPSDRVRRALNRRVRRTGWRRKLAALRPAYRRGAAALAVCGAVGLLLLGLFGTEQNGSSERNRYVSSYEPQAMAVLSRPETVAYPLDWSRKDQFSGNVWYNGSSQELFVLIEDVALSEGLSIQAWAVKNGSRNTLGLVQIEDAKGHLYVKGGQLREADNIALTVEPTGGSESPTSPDAAWVRLLKR
ncbi:anti-sigma factor [Paenibacillus sp. S150]|uniref:anti-sigma factor n=1 Tax=Paenibacillus sp. S150 TaxID=2749826 RepID=UPI001C580D5D|nr:anti-sigma factor [Paenibacillus sp. S150]MBW4085558.1 anti-sigma factor [Paenibacillus sp. S150]